MFTDSPNESTEGDNIAIIVVLQFPPKESSNSLVIYLICFLFGNKFLEKKIFYLFYFRISIRNMSSSPFWIR
jgi:hypothetical protein